MSVLAISFSKHVVSPLEILQEGREISSSNWDLCGPDLCSPKQLCRTSGSVGSHSCCSIGQQHCLTRQALSVAHGDTWQSSDPGAQPPALEWEPGKPQDTGEPAAQLQASASLLSTNPKQPGQAGLLGHLAPRIPKIKEGAGLHYTCLDPELPAKEQCPGQPQVGAVLELLLQQSRTMLVTVCKGVQGNRWKGWADTPLEATKQKSRKLWGKISAFTPGGADRAAMKPMQQRGGDSKGHQPYLCIPRKSSSAIAQHSQDLLMPGEAVPLFRASW